MLKFIIIVTYFLVSGEIISRFANHFLSKSYKVNDELISETDDVTNKNKIYLFGDSFVLGGGIKKEDRLANILDKVDQFKLVNLARPGHTYPNFIKGVLGIEDSIKQGDIILLGINYRSIVSLSKGKVKQIISNREMIENNSKQLNSNNKYIRNNFESKLIQFLKLNIRNTLLREGIMLPFGSFYKLYNQYYNDQVINEIRMGLEYIDHLSKNNNIRTYIYLIPDFNLLSQFKYFEQYISIYKNSNFENIFILNGFDHFKNDHEGKYFISTMDAHPNGEAHKLMARKITEVIY
jgi:hypothetical protein